jgi:adenine-specific DNA-methyltransferase
MDEGQIEKIDLDKVDWRGSREFFESLGEALDKLDDKDESYDFTWVGKRKAIIEAGAPINKTLRPDVENSKNWDTTENLFIEGDNLDALKLLQESYLGKVKMIYIDPPYNTGKDFVYHDNFKASAEQYDEDTEYKDEAGNIQFKKNEKTNGRYHSDWLSMMYPRLKLARNLLAMDGVIFISIDDNEQANLKKLCDEIFGEDNFITQFIWRRSGTGGLRGIFPVTTHEYVLAYGKQADSITRQWMAPYTQDALDAFSNQDEKGRYKTQALYLTSLKQTVGQSYFIELPDGSRAKPPEGVGSWRFIESTYNEELEKGNIVFKQVKGSPLVLTNGEKAQYNIYTKQYMTDEGTNPASIFPEEIVGQTRGARAGLKALFKADYFEYSKPVALVKYLISVVNADKNAVVVDFFSGSGTTAHAVLETNAQDGGSRKWVMVQLPEDTGENSPAFKAGFKTIPEIARERIRRAGDKIASEHPDAKVDYGFRSLVIDDTNYKEVYKSVGKYEQSTLLGSVDNVKEDRSDLDLLFGVLTQSALELNRPLETRDISGAKTFLYDYFGEVSGLVACFDESISEEAVKAIAGLRPLTAVFRDSSFADSQAKVNLAEHFRIISPETKVKVL